MWEAIVGAIGVIATIVSYVIWKKRKGRTAQDLLDSLEKERRLRSELYEKGINALANHDYESARNLELLLKTRRDQRDS